MKQTGSFVRKKETFFPSCHAGCDYDVLARPLCGVDEWNAILVEVIGSFRGGFIMQGPLLPETQSNSSGSLCGEEQPPR